MGGHIEALIQILTSSSSFRWMAYRRNRPKQSNAHQETPVALRVDNGEKSSESFLYSRDRDIR